jgi:hypothetical protein
LQRHRPKYRIKECEQHVEDPTQADPEFVPAGAVSADLTLLITDGDAYELSGAAPTLLNAFHRRRLAPEAVVAFDWHNEMSKLILDINDRMEAAADDRARGVIIRRLRRSLDE